MSNVCEALMVTHYANLKESSAFSIKQHTVGCFQSQIQARVENYTTRLALMIAVF